VDAVRLAEGEAGMKTKEYIRPMPATWWLHNHHLMLFMVRELTSVFAAAYAVLLLVIIGTAAWGTPTFDRFYNGVLRQPWMIALQLVAFVFVVYHSVTWFNLTPKIMVVWRGEEKVSPVLIAGANYAAWLIVSILILLVVL
jgi:fumarate reductase subunit C